MDHKRKPLYLVISVVPDSDETGITMTYGNYEIGRLSVPQACFADFIEGLQTGFRVIISQNPQPLKKT